MVTNSTASGRSSSRIPTTLQSIYLAANRGVSVHDAPRDLAALFSKLSVKNNNNNKAAAPKQPAVAARKPVKPQDQLDAILAERGYRKTTVKSLQTSLSQRPTELQQASYGQYIQRLVKDGDNDRFCQCISAGLSPNPCNKFGESLLHLTCRYGNYELLRRMVWELGTSVLVCDDYGRTALHDACWGNDVMLALGVVDVLVQTIGDASFFLVEDKRGCLPLAYVKQDSWPAWNDYLERRKDAFFPYVRGHKVDPPLCAALQEGPFSRTMPDPKRALSIETAKLVAAGKLSPTLARLQDHPDEEPDAEADETETTSDEDDDASSCSSSSCSSSSYASDEFDDSDVDLSEFSGDVEDEELEKEMALLLRKLG